MDVCNKHFKDNFKALSVRIHKNKWQVLSTILYDSKYIIFDKLMILKQEQENIM